MKSVYFFSPCKYSVSGFSALIEAMPEKSVRVIPIKDTREFLDNINSDTQPQLSVIVVDMTYHERSVFAMSLCFLWNLSVFYSEGTISTNIPCIVLCRDGILNKEIYPFANICPSQSVSQLKNIITEVLTIPGKYIRKLYRLRRLNSKERYVVNASLNGMPLREIAVLMKTSHRKVSYHRYNAIKKIGLQKQYKYTLLMGETLL